MPDHYPNGSLHQQLHKLKASQTRCVSCERYTQHINYRQWKERHKVAQVPHVGLYPSSILKTKEAKKAMQNEAVNTVMTGPLKCDINCITSIRKRDPQSSGCKCGSRSSQSRLASKLVQTGYFINHNQVSKAINNSIETITFGTQFENLAPESPNKSLTILKPISYPTNLDNSLPSKLLLIQNLTTRAVKSYDNISSLIKPQNKSSGPNESVSTNCSLSRILTQASYLGPTEKTINMYPKHCDVAIGTMSDYETNNYLDSVRIEEIEKYFKPRDVRVTRRTKTHLNPNERVIIQNMKQNEIDARTLCYNQSTRTEPIRYAQSTSVGTDTIHELSKSTRPIDIANNNSHQNGTPIGLILKNRLKYLVQKELESEHNTFNTCTSSRPEPLHKGTLKRSETSIGITSEIRTQKWAVSRYPVRGPDF